MKLFSKIVLAGTMVFALAACEKGADPKAELAQLQAWGQENQAKQVQLQTELQQDLATIKSPEDIQVLAGKYAQKIGELSASLEKISVKSPEIVDFKAQMQVVLQDSQAVLNDSLQLVGKQAIGEQASAEEANALQTKMQSLSQKAVALMQLEQQLTEKFNK